ncbi:isochorismatase family protein [Jeongeupia naejangsanensis]|uniref:isochorismatase n=1 Tax=Jeongeupia naejangsanensis TaxID=613195 RepID=A0ABS2BH08_9NEIS|nr:isochorismatase [Jeongeupia naejangsanensis]MBM3114886.1 isochorismatase [Jeongeupia naejangsanensis]
MAIPRIASYPLPTAADLPTNKVNWTPDAGRAVLLVHDMQRYFVDFYDQSQAPVPELVSRIRALITRCRALGIPVAYTAQPGNQTLEDRALLTDFWGTGLAADPRLTDIIADLAPTPVDTVFTKWRYSAFKRSNFERWIKDAGRDQLIICGVYAHIGCLSTALEAFMLDIQPFLVADAVADFSRDEHLMALNYAAGRCASVTTLADTLAALPLPTLSADLVRSDVAAQMGLTTADLLDDDNLLLLGLDSIRLMTLVERWRALGADVGFVDLAETPTLAAWTARLCGEVAHA